MLTVIRELAEEAEAQRRRTPAARRPARALVGAGRRRVAARRSSSRSSAGRGRGRGRGRARRARAGIAAAVTGEALPAAAGRLEERRASTRSTRSARGTATAPCSWSKARRSTAAGSRPQLEPLGDSLMVVGDETALKVHVHTDDPGAALTSAPAAGMLEGIEIANMHRPDRAAETRLLELVPDDRGDRAWSRSSPARGTARLFETSPRRRRDRDRRGRPVDEPVDRRDPGCGREATRRRGDRAAEQLERACSPPSRRPSTRPSRVEVVADASIPAGIAALVAYDGTRSAEENAAEMERGRGGGGDGRGHDARRATSSSTASPSGKGDWLGLVDGDPVAGGADFDDGRRRGRRRGCSRSRAAC